MGWKDPHAMGPDELQQRLAEMVSRAQAIYGDKYGFNRLNPLLFDREKQEIECPEHGYFRRRWRIFLKGYGCPSCSNKKIRRNLKEMLAEEMQARMVARDKSVEDLQQRRDKAARDRAAIKLQQRLEEMVAKAKAAHGDKYGYSRLNPSLKYDAEQEIECFKHGFFRVSLTRHLRFCEGCPRCVLQPWLDRQIGIAKAVHDDKYGYSKLDSLRLREEKNSTQEIECFEHGFFRLSWRSHITGKGCPECERQLYLKWMISRAKAVHGNKYGYDNLVNPSLNCAAEQEIECPEHGFFRLPWREHTSGKGCPECERKLELDSTRVSQLRQDYSNLLEQLELLKPALEDGLLNTPALVLIIRQGNQLATVEDYSDWLLQDVATGKTTLEEAIKAAKLGSQADDFDPDGKPIESKIDDPEIDEPEFEFEPEIDEFEPVEFEPANPQDLPQAFDEDLTGLFQAVHKLDPLDDSVAIQTIRTIFLEAVWQAAYDKDHEAVLIMSEKLKNLNPFAQETISTFLQEYNAARSTDLPPGYSYPQMPTLLQRLVMVRALRERHHIITADMGSGKTRAALMAVRAGKCKRTLIICPNSITNQWRQEIERSWPGTALALVKANSFLPNHNRDTFLIWNVEKLSNIDESILQELIDQGLDSIIFDEGQLVKQRKGQQASRRHINARKLRKMLAKANPNAMVLGSTATPLQNDLTELKRLIELVRAKNLNNVDDKITLKNVINLYQELVAISTRYKRPRNITTVTHTIEAQEVFDELVKAADNSDIFACEKLLAPIRARKIAELAQNQPTLIATLYVSEIIDITRAALQAVGLQVGTYYGSDKSANLANAECADSVAEFRQGKTDVLIGSTGCVSTGLDGLQERCSHLIFATLPWTYSEFDQTCCRLDRLGQTQSVTVHLLETEIRFTDEFGQQQVWSFERDIRLPKLHFKRRLSAAAVDGEFGESEDYSADLFNQARESLKAWAARVKKSQQN